MISIVGDPDWEGRLGFMDQHIRLVIADDGIRSRQSLKALLASVRAGAIQDVRPTIEIVGEAETGDAAVRLVEQIRPDLVLMDMRMPGMNGLEATRVIKAHWPHTRVVILTIYPDHVTEARNAGADALILKGCPAGELLDTLVRFAVAGELPRSDLLHSANKEHTDVDDKLAFVARIEAQLKALTEEVERLRHRAYEVEAQIHQENLRQIEMSRCCLEVTRKRLEALKESGEDWEALKKAVELAEASASDHVKHIEERLRLN